MPRYKLRTLLILTTLGPPMLAWLWFTRRYGVEIGACVAFIVALIGALFFWVGWMALARKAAKVEIAELREQLERQSDKSVHSSNT